ncbi:MAG: hypothetical protein H6619_04480 [Deltaproteobacteria bacterium]|nr:hypothetical protein [Deltaproteobacteria bacterium]
MKFKSLSLLFVALCACNSSSGNMVITDYSGIWDVRYNFANDECGLVTDGIIGFVEQDTIEQSGSTASFSSLSGILSTDSATLESDGSLLAIEEFSGDLFGDGTFCVQTAQIRYQNGIDNSAESVFSFSIECDDGFACSSDALGSAERQV